VTLTTMLVPTYLQMLRALSAWLGKIPEGQADALLSARLAPDMFPLATQIRFACVQAQEGVFRLKGEAFPESLLALLGEGQNAGTHPGSMADAQARIAETVALLEALAPDALYGDPQRPIAHAIPSGMIFDLTAEQYARDWTLAQFYFHLMTAYAILRNGGIDLGKVDYVGHLLGYVRPAPTG
jgi:hypothetical protein